MMNRVCWNVVLLGWLGMLVFSPPVAYGVPPAPIARTTPTSPTQTTTPTAQPQADKKAPSAEVTRRTKPPKRRVTKDEPLPWRLDTRVPMYLVGGGGLLLTSIGLIGTLGEPEKAPLPAGQAEPPPSPTPWGVLFFGGLSVMSSSVSAALWRRKPKAWMATLGSVVAGGITVTGILLAALGTDELMLSMGWGFIASAPIHIGLNIVGWMNVKNWQKAKQLEEQTSLPPRPHDSSLAQEPPQPSATHTLGRFE